MIYRYLQNTYWYRREIIRSILQKKGCNPRKDGLQPFIPYYI